MPVIVNKVKTDDTVTREISEAEFNAATLENVDMDKYAKNYSENGLWDKIKGTLKDAGIGLIYKALKLYYATENPNCPQKVKLGIYAALGYFITPFDIVPDFLPLAGFTDDVSTIAIALTVAHLYIDDTVKQKAKDRIRGIFGDKIANELD